MKKLLLLGMVAGLGSPAFADITHRLQSSVQLQTNAAATQVSRIGSTYSASGSGVTMAVGDASGQVGGLGTLTDGVVKDQSLQRPRQVQAVHIHSLDHSLKVMLL